MAVQVWRIGHISNVIGSRAGDDDDDSGQDPLEIAGAYNVTATVVDPSTGQTSSYTSGNMGISDTHVTLSDDNAPEIRQFEIIDWDNAARSFRVIGSFGMSPLGEWHRWHWSWDGGELWACRAWTASTDEAVLNALPSPDSSSPSTGGCPYDFSNPSLLDLPWDQLTPQ